jgi:hypothetical protein
MRERRGRGAERLSRERRSRGRLRELGRIE